MRLGNQRDILQELEADTENHEGWATVAEEKCLQTEMDVTRLLHTDRNAVCYAATEHRQARHRAHQVLAVAGLTKELQNQLQQSQKTAVDELTSIVAQGRLKIHSRSNLARKEHEFATVEAHRFKEECGIVQQVRDVSTTNQDTLRAELVDLYNIMHRQEVEQREFEIQLRDELMTSEVAIQMQVADPTLEAEQESRAVLEHQARSQQLVKDEA